MKRRHQTTLYSESTVNRFSTIYNTVRLSELWSSNNHLTKLIHYYRNGTLFWVDVYQRRTLTSHLPLFHEHAITKL